VQASIDYGVTVLGAPLVVVLGHDSCGAIQATRDALRGVPLPDPGLWAIVDRVMPSLREAQENQLTDDDEVAAFHVQRTVDMIMRPDTVVADAVASGHCAVVGMTYRLADGRVTVVRPADART
jgi:carbonic anhydrase